MAEQTLNGMCQSCMMPFKKDPLGANRESDKYCSYCYFDGKLAYEGNDPKEFQKIVYKAITDRGENKLKAWFFAYMATKAPRWKTSNSVTIITSFSVIL